MKKVFNIILFLIITFIFSTIVNASTSLKSSNQNPVLDNTFLVRLYVDYGKDKKISSASYKILFDSSVFSVVDTAWSQKIDNYEIKDGEIIIDKTSNTKSWETGAIVIVEFKANKAKKSTIRVEKTKEAYFEDGQIVNQTISNVTISPIVPDSSTSLKTFYVKNYNINPTFSKEKYNYKLKVPSDVDNIEVIAEKANSKQTITGTGFHKLKYGDNKISVKVVSESKKQAIYTILVTREDNRSGDTTLKKLTVSNTNITYQENVYNYEADVYKGIDEVLISATANDNLATLTGTGRKKLVVGQNTFNLVIKTKNEKEAIYTITINKIDEEKVEEKPSSKIKTMKINNNPVYLFTDNTIIYSFQTTKKKLNIDLELTSENATYEIVGNDNLSSGINIINITTSLGEEKTEYTLYVYKNNNSWQKINELSETFTNKNILFERLFSNTELINKSVIDELVNNNSTLYYNVLNESRGLLYQLEMNKNVNPENINPIFQQDDTSPNLYHTTIPKNIDILLFVGDRYPNNTNLKIDTFNDGEPYTLLTDGAKVVDGYVKLTTNGKKNYSLSINNSQNQSFLTNLIAKSKTIIIIIVAGLLIIVLLKFSKKKKKVEEEY